MVKNQLASPVVKWAGGKRQLLGELLPRVPRRFGMYCEPFLGGRRYAAGAPACPG